LSTYWDQTTFNVTNNTGLKLAVANVPNLDHGEYGSYPASVAAGATTSQSFVAQSKNASEIGPQGSLAYQLADGTQLNVAFDQEFAVYQTSTFNVALAGAPAGGYGVSLTNSWDTWHGQGARWTVNLTLSPDPGESSAQCSYER
jgi:hypothetical protein